MLEYIEKRIMLWHFSCASIFSSYGRTRNYTVRFGTKHKISLSVLIKLELEHE